MVGSSPARGKLFFSIFPTFYFFFFSLFSEFRLNYESLGPTFTTVAIIEPIGSEIRLYGDFFVLPEHCGVYFLLTKGVIFRKDIRNIFRLGTHIEIKTKNAKLGKIRKKRKYL